ncbi:hypothetical protein [Paenibacillus xylanexedens]|uniref:hypothetical protein n=1 Tax=Paenibacillus xylanexedens TaxID=528191 RepID=UPI0028E8576C|nr:hypothetical protein [Paenibacillus xylanexedens]
MLLITYKPGQNATEVNSITDNPGPEETVPNSYVTDQAIPIPNDIPGMIPILYTKVDTKTLYYNYIKPETIDSLISQLQEQQAVIKAAMDDLIIGGVL